MHLKIKNLFGYRNYDLELNDKINILIGENGSGKSTILKIISCIFNGDLLVLSEIEFEEICFDLSSKYEGIVINIKREDIVQIEEFARDARFKYIFKDYLMSYLYPDKLEDIQEGFDEFFKGLKAFFNKNKSDIYIKPSKKINKEEELVFYFDEGEFIGNQYFSSDVDNDNNAFEISKVTSLYYNIFRNETKYSLIYFYNIYLLNCLIKNKVNFLGLPEIIDGKIILKYDDILPYSFNKNLHKLVHVIDLDCNLDDFVRFNADKEYFDQILSKENWFKVISVLSTGNNEKNINSYCENNKYKYNILDFNNYKNYIRILKIIKRHKYKLDNIEDYNIFKNNFGFYYENYINNIDEILENKKNLDNISDIVKVKDEIESLNTKKYTCHKYIVDLSENEYKGLYSENRILDIIFDLNMIMDKSKEINIEEYFDLEPAKRFYYLSKKYFYNKYFLLGYDEENKIKIHIFNKDTNEELDLNVLSSGENKMLRFIKLLCFKQRIHENSREFNSEKLGQVLAIDEPELSLSIYWQQMIVEDIEKYGENMLVFFATQSTNLVKEKQFKYLVEVDYEK